MVTDVEDIVLAFDEDAFTKVNKKLLCYVNSGTAAILFGELIGLHKMNKNQDQLEPDGAFPCPIRLFQKQLGIPAARQKRAFELLEKKSLINSSTRGFPAARYIKINFDTMLSVFANAKQVAQLEAYKKESFYEKINLGMAMAFEMVDPVPTLDALFDKMRTDARGVITLLSHSWLSQSKNPLKWDSKLTGQIINWVRNRTTGKVLDFSLVTRTLDIDVLKHGFNYHSFDKFISSFLSNSKTTPEVHYSEQKYAYTDLLLRRIHGLES